MSHNRQFSNFEEKMSLKFWGQSFLARNCVQIKLGFQFVEPKVDKRAQENVKQGQQSKKQ